MSRSVSMDGRSHWEWRRVVPALRELSRRLVDADSCCNITDPRARFFSVRVRQQQSRRWRWRYGWELHGRSVRHGNQFFRIADLPDPSRNTPRWKPAADHRLLGTQRRRITDYWWGCNCDSYRCQCTRPDGYEDQRHHPWRDVRCE